MLQAGEYREGVVFAGIDLRKTKSIEDVNEDAEEIMTVDASAAEPEADEADEVTGLKKGVYKLTVKIKAAGDRHYASKTKNVRVTIRVK